ncbi:MAG: trypsin-like peptidase domain-containing protein [Actinomycetota bacterium]|nr:trypsin-like peptidase domain-containing protein [Actinomycetota bacterium]
MKKASVLAATSGCAAVAALLAAPLGASAIAAPAQIDTAAVAKAVEPSVVDISTVLDPLEGNGATAAAGTGMIVSPGGLVVTNNHVVSGADSITVTVPGHGRHAATFVGSDPSQDIAFIKVAGLSNLRTIKWGNSSAAGVGTAVVAIGNALGLGGQPTVTQGIISATGRTITAQDETGANQETLHGLLQTDAPIAPGNSGGPLVDASDQVIGMDTAAASAGTGASLGFAIPSNRIRAIAGDIESHKQLPGFVYGRSAFLGVEVVDSSQVSSNPFGFGPFGFGAFGVGPSAPTKPGVVVEEVDPDGGAASAGIQAGDEITAVDGKAVTTTSALSKDITSHKPGQVVQVTVFTGYADQTLKVRLGEAPVD